MVKNVIFDLGNVLLDFDPLSYLENLGFDDILKNKLNKIIFKSNDWIEYDRGIYLHNVDIIKKIAEEYPEYKNEVNLVLQDDWVKIHTIKEETATFLKELKAKGMKIYILSNISKDTYEYISNFDFFNHVDGGVYSYEVNICKPDKMIYKILLEKYGLIPTETVFFDDRLDNVESAIKLGIHGIRFTTLEEAKKTFSDLTNLI